MKKVIVYNVRALLEGSRMPAEVVKRIAKRIPHESCEQYLQSEMNRGSEMAAWEYIGVDYRGKLIASDFIESFLPVWGELDMVIEIHVIKDGDL